MQKFNAETLDDCFLLLSEEQDRGGYITAESQNIDDDLNVYLICDNNGQTVSFENNKYSKSRMQALIMKNFIPFMRHYW